MRASDNLRRVLDQGLHRKLLGEAHFVQGLAALVFEKKPDGLMRRLRMVRSWLSQPVKKNLLKFRLRESNMRKYVHGEGES